MTTYCDVAVIGAGLIGASAAAHIADHRKTVLIEQESQPGYHSSGRSAAILLPPYGGPIARALTAASTDLLLQPPGDFSQVPLTTPRGAIFVASPDQLALLDRWQSSGGDNAPRAQTLSAEEVVQRVPILKTERIAAGLLLSDVRDIDAAALLQGYVKLFRSRGGRLMLNSTVSAIRRDEGAWVIETTSGAIRAGIIVNAAGAWADDIAQLAGVARKGLVPTRRTMIVVDGPPDADVRQWPMISDVAETFYFKPEVGRLIVSPADRSPVAAQDVQPEEWDVAVAVDRLEIATTLKVRRIHHCWAGLRTLSPDGEPIVGFEPDMHEFLWAAAFGGFGVQAASAAGRCCEALVCDQPLSAGLSQCGVRLDQLSPKRLSRPV